jgi:hypothetical protein
MATNDKPCKDCAHYDVIRLGRGAKSNKGWCAKKSKYPYQEGPGQIFPPGVDRVGPGELAQPVIVRGAGVVSNCEQFTQIRLTVKKK